MACEVQDLSTRLEQLEADDMDFTEVLMLFRDLLDSGLIWLMPANYNMVADTLLTSGFIVAEAGEYRIDWALVEDMTELEMAA